MPNQLRHQRLGAVDLIRFVLSEQFELHPLSEIHASFMYPKQVHRGIRLIQHKFPRVRKSLLKRLSPVIPNLLPDFGK